MKSTISDGLTEIDVEFVKSIISNVGKKNNQELYVLVSTDGITLELENSKGTSLGITTISVETLLSMLPKKNVLNVSDKKCPIKYSYVDLNRKKSPCPECNLVCGRKSVKTRELNDIGTSTKRVILKIIYSQHYCKKCNIYFSVSMLHLAKSRSSFTDNVRTAAIEIVKKQNETVEYSSRKMREEYNVNIGESTIHDWIVAERK